MSALVWVLEMIFGTIVAPILVMRTLDFWLARKKRRLESLKKALHSLDSALKTWELFEGWEKVRPFLHVRQSAYSMGLVESMIRDMEDVIRYEIVSKLYPREHLRLWEETLVLLNALLSDFPPGDEPTTRKALSEKMGLCFFVDF